MRNRTELNVKVSLYDTQVKSFLKLLSTIKRLGVYGASRTFKLSVDGDGYARLKFEVDDIPLDPSLYLDEEKWKKLENDQPYCITIE